ncbi:TadE/TadG family type IV pilus assembly protein [Natribacillus halophilus]|uniref:TadE-like protein n=1 Tax=Natribacillus halophilus TaxID=549003 RepID=A0A1G8QBZ1_9BACI|nr:pilus assembly protein [Natribacillus halophilus]SDJ01975.1 hypothetical protein SAMN04488123_11156 [Natribacillus halophilus]
MLKHCKKERGSATIELLGVLPFIFMFFLILWQAVASGYAVMSSQSAVNEAAKVYAVTEEAHEAEDIAREVVGESSALSVQNFSITPDGSGYFEASISVDHGLIFVPSQWRSEASVTLDHSVTSRVIP